MKRSTLLLAATTLVLAATSAALLQQLRTERARAQAEATLRAQWEARFRDLYRSRSIPQLAQPPAAASATAAQPGGKPADAPGQSSSAARSRDERFLALLATPTGHAQLLAEGKSQLRQRYPDMARVLHLTSEQESQILTAQAEGELKGQARVARCRLDPSCTVESLWRSGLADLKNQDKPVEDLLGAQKFGEYEGYLNTITDRQSVRSLNARLSSADALTDEQAEALVTAMQQERKQFAAEAEQTGRRISAFGTQTGGLMAATEGTGNPASDTEILTSAREFSQRLRDRAAKLLTLEQMREFDELQEETLTRTQESLRLNRDARLAGQ